jgi:hypothetical protein
MSSVTIGDMAPLISVCGAYQVLEGLNCGSRLMIKGSFYKNIAK